MLKVHIRLMLSDEKGRQWLSQETVLRMKDNTATTWFVIRLRQLGHTAWSEGE